MRTRHRKTGNYFRFSSAVITVVSGAVFDEALPEQPDLMPSRTVAMSSAPATYVSSIAFRF